MKVALIESHAVPGVWKYDLALAMELSRLGAQVTIMTSKAFPSVASHSFDGPILRYYPDLRAHATQLAKGLHYVAGVGKTLWRLHTGGFDVIHWQQYNVFPPVETAMTKMLLGLQGRLVMTVHDVTAWSVVKGKAHVLLQTTYRSAKRLIVHHAVNRDELLATFQLPSERVRVVPHGSFTHFVSGNLSRAHSRHLLGLPENVPLVLFFGEVRPEKGLIYLLRAMKSIRSRIPDVHLLVAGRLRHMDMSECLAEIQTSGLTEAVSLQLEYIKEELVETYLSAADVIVLPYIAISQSGVLLEAMTVGCPVVVTDVGALGPTVREAQVGLVVPPEQIQPLADAVVVILTDPKLAQCMAQNGQRAARDTYSWSRCARDTMDIYREL